MKRNLPIFQVSTGFRLPSQKKSTRKKNQQENLAFRTFTQNCFLTGHETQKYNCTYFAIVALFYEFWIGDGKKTWENFCEVDKKHQVRRLNKFTICENCSPNDGLSFPRTILAPIQAFPSFCHSFTVVRH